jgi:hypothetical protein
VEIDFHLQDHNTRLSNFQQMPQPDFDILGAPLCLHLEEEELSYDVDALRHDVSEGERSLNEGQRRVWDEVNDALDAMNDGITPQVSS